MPPTSSLACFEATVRHGSVTQAAEELNLTQSAVSKRITALEEYLGRMLFVRKNRRLLPTPAAREYAKELSDIINRIEISTTKLISYGRQGGVLTVAVLPTFGSRWLVPRIADFLSNHPTIEINLISKIRPFDFDKETAHVAIHFGQPQWPRARCEYLMDETVAAVCAPTMAGKAAGFLRLEDINRHTLIQHTTRPHLWREWLTVAGGSTARALAGPRFEYYSLVIEAAVAGIGIAVLPELLIRNELQRGLLVRAHQSVLTCEEKYFAVYPEKFADNINILDFVAWLKAECAGEQIASADSVMPASKTKPKLKPPGRAPDSPSRR